MILTNNISINMYSIIFLLIIYVHSINHDDRVSMHSKLYTKLLQITIVLLMFDTMSRFDGNADTIYSWMNHIGNFMVFILGPILPSLWLMYVHLQVISDESKTLKLIPPLAVLFIVHGVMMVINLFNGWVYYIDDGNIYHRGPFFLVSLWISIGLLLVASVIIIINRKRTEDRYYYSLLFFGVPPMLSTALQYVFYGTSLVLNSVVISCLIIFLNIQNQSIYTDHLTGVYNRKMLEKQLKTKANVYNNKKPFAAIMVDLNDFKSINDTYGHEAGDRALKTVSKVLKKSIKNSDFISRFGGDEFCMVLDILDDEELKTTVRRIQSNVEKYNLAEKVPYKLCLSMGYAIYNDEDYQNIEAFQKHIDLLMYANKEMKNQDNGRQLE